MQDCRTSVWAPRPSKAAIAQVGVEQTRIRIGRDASIFVAQTALPIFRKRTKYPQFRPDKMGRKQALLLIEVAALWGVAPLEEHTSSTIELFGRRHREIERIGIPCDYVEQRSNGYRVFESFDGHP